MVLWWLLLQNSLQYSDGRVEIVDVPKAFTVGDVVAVTHRRDGGVVVQRVSPPLYSAGIEIYLGEFLSGEQVRVRFASIASGNTDIGTLTFQFLYGESGVSEQTYNIPSGNYWQAELVTHTFTLPYDSEVTFRIIANVLSGVWYVIDYLDYYYPTARRGELLPDGNFESGSFGDGITQWKKLGAKTEIVLNPSYDSSYACKFYG
ncbi:MAG: hypothetical protein BWY95_02631 [Bacteroidetes bacterium ADurb.BinA104]|nr:MAG: hypothetical protein BWY95_02631 [Bacteroidetes bacterium ADurb.BinA104]